MKSMKDFYKNGIEFKNQESYEEGDKGNFDDDGEYGSGDGDLDEDFEL